MHIKLQWTFLTDWQSASGQEAGAYADQLCIKDAHNLPYLPGKSIKGLFRQAFRIAEDNGWFTQAPDTLTALLFGAEGRAGVESQGILQFSNATLSDAEKTYFIEHPEHSRHLFRVLHSTAIDSDTGVALSTSLRATEVAIPMPLTSVININAYHSNLTKITDWQSSIPYFIDAVLPLIDVAGAKRRRGLGVVEVSVLQGGR